MNPRFERVGNLLVQVDESGTAIAKPIVQPEIRHSRHVEPKLKRARKRLKNRVRADAHE